MEEVYLCPVASFYAIAEGKTGEDRTAWEIARWQSYLAMRLSPYIKDYNRPKTPADYWAFPWELSDTKTKHETVELTEGQFGELRRIIDNLKSR